LNIIPYFASIKAIITPDFTPEYSNNIPYLVIKAIIIPYFVLIIVDITPYSLFKHQDFNTAFTLK